MEQTLFLLHFLNISFYSCILLDFTKIKEDKYETDAVLNAAKFFFNKIWPF